MAVPNVEVVKPDVWDLDFLIFLPLATQNERGELEGRLARSWEHSSDHREYTFHLRTDVRWDDGVPVTAHDVKFTLELLSHPDAATGYRFESPTVLDDSTVVIRSANGPGYLLDIVYYPKHLVEDLDPKRFWEWDFWTHPVGDGPYRFVRYVPQTMMEFEANPDYYRGKPRIERVILKFVGGAGAAGLTALLSGDADIAQADLTQLPQIASDPRFRIYHNVAPSARAIYWKCDHPLFRDPRVRGALTLALDRQELLRLLNLPADLPITDGVFTRRQFRRGEWPEPLPYDPAQARALLEAAGWSDRDEEGIRENAGRAFRLPPAWRATPECRSSRYTCRLSCGGSESRWTYSSSRSPSCGTSSAPAPSRPGCIFTSMGPCGATSGRGTRSAIGTTTCSTSSTDSRPQRTRRKRTACTPASRRSSAPTSRSRASSPRREPGSSTGGSGG